MAYKAPGKHFRKGLSVKGFFALFPDDETAEQWFIGRRWPNGIACPYCESDNVNTKSKHKSMPFRCRKNKAGGCGKDFSVKTNTFMDSSNIGYQNWLFALYLLWTSLKSVSSMKLHRDLEITQKSAWHLAHRIRKSWGSDGDTLFTGPVEIDESYFGGSRKNMSKSKRARLTGRGPTGKTAVVGAKDRRSNRVSAKVVNSTDQPTLHGFVADNVEPGAKVYTDDHRGYIGLPNHESVRHSFYEYVKGDVHVNGIESFWSMLKRAHKGTFHKLSPKHLDRYIGEFVTRHNFRELDTLDQMALVASTMDGAKLRYKDLVG